MIIHCSLSTSQEGIMHYARQFIDLPPLPAYITKNGPYVKNEKGGKYQIIICYEFDKSKFVEAVENTCNAEKYYVSPFGMVNSASFSPYTVI
jgi:hypothetical protein